MASKQEEHGGPDLPIACTLTPDQLRRGRDALLPGIIARAEAREPMPDGFRYRFATGDGLLRDIAAMIEAERACCRFLRFVVTAEPGEEAVWMDVTGPDGTADFLAAWEPASHGDGA